MFRFGPFSVLAYVSILLVTSRCPSALPVAGGTDSLTVFTDDVPPSIDISHHPFPARLNLASEPSSIWRRDTSMPDWDKIAKYAKEQWGNGKHKVVTNDKHFPQYPALLCAPSTETVAVTYTGQPQCMTNNASSQGVLSGTSGTVSISVGQGYTVSSSFVLSSTTSAELFGSFTTMTTFPDITTVMQGFTTSATISNTQSDSLTETYNTMQTSTLVMVSQTGQECVATLVDRTCVLTGTGVLKLVGTGYVAFEYTKKVKGHYIRKSSCIYTFVPTLSYHP
ncbi:uncharacterized protein C8R40DRAFT_1070898 [Lentinula edodes]|uniref:uncharacterized protein n=1 Tax=Lentinula edodes TaxID=5353 RepID=UPI001E8E0E2B|nr:uncharacterized protein C8R40DRAFT_1070898 [Lentinula edodes]KAH7873704.1 hypothetical protein C8R40DRAFT_1070898 [Lentinula edodes]